MSGIPLLLGDTTSLMYLIPLLLVCSLVYGATRHELPEPIWQNSIRTLVWLLSFIGILFGVFLIFSLLI
jgi:hypothetical protein|tara:strand:- start:328 stop:534 length:207 start_codon:yes stop_codon:yes gene_type:complete